VTDEPVARQPRHFLKRPVLLEQVRGAGHDDDLLFALQEVPARSGRPPRETTAAICAVGWAASCNAAAAPVLAPKSPVFSVLVAGFWPSQAAAMARRPVSSGMSKRFS
jgi:hypothetical protein